MAVNKARQGRLHNLNCKYMPKKGTRGWWGVGQRETAIERASEKAKGDQMRNACICMCVLLRTTTTLFGALSPLYYITSLNLS